MIKKKLVDINNSLMYVLKIIIFQLSNKIIYIGIVYL
jgi:hypothetical protein